MSEYSSFIMDGCKIAPEKAHMTSLMGNAKYSHPQGKMRLKDFRVNVSCYNAFRFVWWTSRWRTRYAYCLVLTIFIRDASTAGSFTTRSARCVASTSTQSNPRMTSSVHVSWWERRIVVPRRAFLFWVEGWGTASVASLSITRGWGLCLTSALAYLIVGAIQLSQLWSYCIVFRVFMWYQRHA